METVKKKDFIEIKYSGYVNGNVFDSNIEEDMKKLDPKAKVRKTIVIVGENMIVTGLDKSFEGKEIGKDYEITLSPNDAFGLRKRELLKTIPLRIFSEKKINPQVGMSLALDNAIVKIVAISGARVITDFNNPLAGKEVTYKFKIIRKVSEEKEKIETVFELLMRFVPEFEIKEKIIVKGPKGFDEYIKSVNDKFKELIGKDLGFEEMKEKKVETKEEKKEEEKK